MARTHGPGRAALAALGLLACAAGAQAEEHCEGGVCVSYQESRAGVDFAVANPLPVPISVHLAFSDLQNVEPSPAEETDAVVAASARQELAALRIRDATRPHLYRFRWSFSLGDPKASHDPATRYLIPFGGSTPRELAQGANGEFSHRGEYAFDFLMPIGTPVLAARPGIVAWVVDRFERGGARKSLASEANEVVVAHADGSLARYVHLSRGAAVAVGDEVAAGARLGHSGNTGYTTQPHLHFEVYTAAAGGKRSTVPIRFASEDPRGFEPVVGSFYPPQ
jgi:murein DD-endopeptidase MepM/ murein hydrolase activator NlpD